MYSKKFGKPVFMSLKVKVEKKFMMYSKRVSQASHTVNVFSKK